MGLRRPGFCLGLYRPAKVLTACSNKILFVFSQASAPGPALFVGGKGLRDFSSALNAPGQCSGQLGRTEASASCPLTLTCLSWASPAICPLSPWGPPEDRLGMTEDNSGPNPQVREN